jgi:hypothetical protein
LNYFNYFTEIEDAFVRRRGKHLLLSPIDWALIESWKEMNLPLHVALRGIEKAFDSWESKPRKRSVKSLLYCQEEVEAQYAEWLESQVGASNESTPAEQLSTALQAKTETDEGLPFSRSAVLDHLRRERLNVSALAQERKRVREDDLSLALERAAALLAELEEEFATSVTPNAQKLEISLTGLERMLTEAIFSVVSTETRSALEAEAKEQLKPYRRHMEKAVYQQTFDNLLLKRLREHFAVPRLSLFYL